MKTSKTYIATRVPLHEGGSELPELKYHEEWFLLDNEVIHSPITIPWHYDYTFTQYLSRIHDEDGVAKTLPLFKGDGINLMRLADVCSIRFLPKGIGIVRRARWMNTFVANPWMAITANVNDGEIIDSEECQQVWQMIEDAFEKGGVLIKAGKFAKMLGASDRQAEEFSRKYDLYHGDPDEAYRFDLLTGKDILEGYNTSNYANRNDSPLWNSCMNDKNSIISFYANNKSINLAVVYHHDKVVARSIIWLDTTIVSDYTNDKWKVNDVVYTGAFADRQYYHSDEALTYLRKELRNRNIAYKQGLSAGSGLMCFQMCNEWHTHDTDDFRITAKVNKVAGKVPYLDTLCYISSNKVASNHWTDGKLAEAHHTDGSTRKMGVYVTLAYTKDEKPRVVGKRSAIRVLLPDGKIVNVSKTANIVDDLVPMYDTLDADIYVIKSLVHQQDITIPSINKYRPSEASTYTLRGNFYPSQLDVCIAGPSRFSSNCFSVSKVYDYKRERFIDISEAVMVLGRYGMPKAIRKASKKQSSIKANSVTI